jgi:4-hydroxy-tetrahydrodipicolinate reductase
MRIGITGIAGRMGSLLATEVTMSSATLVGGTVRPGSTRLVPDGINIVADISELAQCSDVVIDFTGASTVCDHATALVASQTAWILGSTGLSAEDERLIEKVAQTIPVVHAANFSAGVTLMLMLAEQMAATLPELTYDAEISEMHHRHKVDSPSGTAIALARAVAKGRKQEFNDAINQNPRFGHVGPRKVGEIGFAVMRGGSVVGDHAVIFASPSEHLTIQHHAVDRRVFAAGALQAAFWVNTQPAGLYSMQDVIRKA